jgi:hypothetical protein
MVFPEQLAESRIELVVGAVREFLTAEGREKAIWSVSEQAEPSDLVERLLAFGMKPNDVPGVEERHAEMVCLESRRPDRPASSRGRRKRSRSSSPDCSS